MKIYISCTILHQYLQKKSCNISPTKMAILHCFPNIYIDKKKKKDFRTLQIQFFLQILYFNFGNISFLFFYLFIKYSKIYINMVKIIIRHSNIIIKIIILLINNYFYYKTCKKKLLLLQLSYFLFFQDLKTSGVKKKHILQKYCIQFP